MRVDVRILCVIGFMLLSLDMTAQTHNLPEPQMSENKQGIKSHSELLFKKTNSQGEKETWKFHQKNWERQNQNHSPRVDCI